MTNDKILELIQDIRKLPKVIPLNKVDELCDRKLKTDEVIGYLQRLKKGSLPEPALRESFFAGKSLLREILGELTPEATLTTGFVDYKIEDEFGRIILLELKSYYVASRDELREEKLFWENHKGQLFKYMSEKYRYVILTDLNEWHFFSNKQCLTEKKTEPFESISLDGFYKELKKEANLWD